MNQSCSELQERVVIDASGVALGEVIDVLFDSSSWRVAALRVRLRRTAAEGAGVHAGLFRRPTIDVPSAMVSSVGDAVLLSVAAAALGALGGDDAHAPG